MTKKNTSKQSSKKTKLADVKEMLVVCLIDGNTHRFYAEDGTPVVVTKAVRETTQHEQLITLQLTRTDDGRCYKIANKPKKRYDARTKAKAKIADYFEAYKAAHKDVESENA